MTDAAIEQKAPTTRRAYYTLDGLKGLAALLVATRHVPFFFRGIDTPETYLAVDLFYLLSGFVVAHAYEQRLSAAGFTWTFMKTRLIRLYPMYLLGMALSIWGASISVVTDPKGWWNLARLLEAIGYGLFLVPLLPGMHANGGSLNGPTWTLLPELIANLLYALLLPLLRLPVLIAIVICFGAGVFYVENLYGALDVGYGVPDQWAGLVRTGFSFFAGVLIFRLVGNRKRVAPSLAWACLAVLAGLMCFHPPEDWEDEYLIATVLIGFPALITAAACVEPEGASARLFAFAGAASYGVYILHQPLGRLVRFALQHHPFAPPLSFAIGAVFLLALFPLARWLDRKYDAPVRRWLTARFLKPRPAAA